MEIVLIVVVMANVVSSLRVKKKSHHEQFMWVNVSDCATGYEGLMCSTCSAAYYDNGGGVNTPNCEGQYYVNLEPYLEVFIDKIPNVSIACNCEVANTNGASANCDASGQCDCVANTYGTTCTLCNCNTGGTENGSGACDSSGVCTCKEGIVFITISIRVVVL